MNQTGSKTLSLSGDEARNLHTEIFDLLARLAEYDSMANEIGPSNEVIQISLDGSKF